MTDHAYIFQISKNSLNAYRVKYSPRPKSTQQHQRSACASSQEALPSSLLCFIASEMNLQQIFISRVFRHNVARMLRLLQCCNVSLGDKSLLYRSLTADDGKYSWRWPKNLHPLFSESLVGTRCT